MIEDLKADLIRDEGIRLKVYRCPAGKLTVGVGRNLEDTGISHQESMVMLENDIYRVSREVNERLPQFRLYPEIVRRALLNMAFNLGVTGLLKFKKMFAALDAEDYQQAATEALSSKWASQVGTRSERIAALIREGQST